VAQRVDFSQPGTTVIGDGRGPAETLLLRQPGQ
jgi:hypothetical protein